MALLGTYSYVTRSCTRTLSGTNPSYMHMHAHACAHSQSHPRARTNLAVRHALPARSVAALQCCAALQRARHAASTRWRPGGVAQTGREGAGGRAGAGGQAVLEGKRVGDVRREDQCDERIGERAAGSLRHDEREDLDGPARRAAVVTRTGRVASRGCPSRGLRARCRARRAGAYARVLAKARDAHLAAIGPATLLHVEDVEHLPCRAFRRLHRQGP